jgi:hypothetical protein
LTRDIYTVSWSVGPGYALQSFREDVSVSWLLLHAHAESSVDSDLSTHPLYRVVGSNIPTAGARNKPPLDPPQMPVDPGPSDLSSSSHDTAPPLHFHGLAVTQTQTQVASSAGATGEGDALRESRVGNPLLLNFTRLLPSPCRCVCQ